MTKDNHKYTVIRRKKRKIVLTALSVVGIFILAVCGFISYQTHKNEQVTKGFDTTEYSADCRKDINQARAKNHLNPLADNQVDTQVASERSPKVYRNLVDFHTNSNLGAHGNDDGFKMMEAHDVLPSSEDVMEVKVGQNTSRANQSVYKFNARRPEQLARQTVNSMLYHDSGADYGHRNSLLANNATHIGIYCYLSHARDRGVVIMELSDTERGMMR